MDTNSKKLQSIKCNNNDVISFHSKTFKIDKLMTALAVLHNKTLGACQLC
jgi:hypothetical protein